MRFSVVSLKCMYRGIHKLRTGKGEEGSVQKCASIVLATSLLCESTYKGEGRGQKIDLFERT